MTLSSDARRKNADQLLRELFDVVGLDRDYDATYHDADDPQFAGIKPTTWRELVNWRRIKHLQGTAADYFLTGSGWEAGLELAGLSATARGRCIPLLTALKGCTDRYAHGDSRVHLRDLATATGLAQGFCFNVLQSGFLLKAFPDHDYSVRVDHPHVYIPPTFGHQPMDLFEQSSSSVARWSNED